MEEVDNDELWKHGRLRDSDINITRLQMTDEISRI